MLCSVCYGSHENIIGAHENIIVNLIFVSSGKCVAHVGWPKKDGLCISN